MANTGDSIYVAPQATAGATSIYMDANTVNSDFATIMGNDPIYPGKMWSPHDDSAEGWLNSRIDEVVRGI